MEQLAIKQIYIVNFHNRKKSNNIEEPNNDAIGRMKYETNQNK